MKNIVWQLPDGKVAIHDLPDGADSEAVAAEMLNSGSVDPTWVAALFDAEEFPEPPQHTWVIVGGVLTADQTARTAWLKDTILQYARSLRSDIFPLADGLQATYNTLGNSVNAMALETYKDGLRNITLTDFSGATTEEEMRQRIVDAYKVLRDALPVAVKLKFYQTLQ